MAAILGISAFYHDAAAALVVDGRIVAAAQEERFTRKKHDDRFPVQAIEYCLAEAGLKASELDWVGFYDKPLLKFERLLETYLAYAPRGFRSFCRALPMWVGEKLFVPRIMSAALGGAYRRRFVFVEHHESHAAAAFFPSPFEEAAILTFDGVGEWATASLGHGAGNRIRLTRQLKFPHSLGLLYSAFTYYTGFRVNSGEYKVMGLAPYGRPKYAQLIYDHLLDLKDDGSFRLDMSYFNYCQGSTMTSAKFHRLFGSPPRQPESTIGQREMDLAASVQAVTEEILLRAARHIHRQTGSRNLVMAGGVAMNCVANGRIQREGPFEKIWIQPAAGDAGGALGVAQFIHYQLLDHPRTPAPRDDQQGSLLGPRFTNDQIEQFLQKVDAQYDHLADDDVLCDLVARLLSEGKVVGWFSGRMEFGPRALGARSILGDARSAEMQSLVNLKIKFRESFRPFAPTVLEERAGEYFELPPGQDSPYMLLTAPVRKEKRLPLDADDEAVEGFEKMRVRRSVVPAVTHVDSSARVQTVDAVRNGRFYKLLKAFERRTGSPVLINTSFNVRGEPIVCTPEEAYRCFAGSNMDVLVLENFVLKKAEQTALDQSEAETYRAQFQLD